MQKIKKQNFKKVAIVLVLFCAQSNQIFADPWMHLVGDLVFKKIIVVPITFFYLSLLMHDEDQVKFDPVGIDEENDTCSWKHTFFGHVVSSELESDEENDDMPDLEVIPGMEVEFQRQAINQWAQEQRCKDQELLKVGKKALHIAQTRKLPSVRYSDKYDFKPVEN